MWYGVQNMSKYDIDIKVQPLTMKTEFKEVEDVVDIGIGDIIVSVIAT